MKYFTISFTLPASLTKCVLFMTKIHYKRDSAYDMIYVHRLLSSLTHSAQGGCGGRSRRPKEAAVRQRAKRLNGGGS